MKERKRRRVKRARLRKSVRALKIRDGVRRERSRKTVFVDKMMPSRKVQEFLTLAIAFIGQSSPVTMGRASLSSATEIVTCRRRRQRNDAWSLVARTIIRKRMTAAASTTAAASAVLSLGLGLSMVMMVMMRMQRVRDRNLRIILRVICRQSRAVVHVVTLILQARVGHVVLLLRHVLLLLRSVLLLRRVLLRHVLLLLRRVLLLLRVLLLRLWRIMRMVVMPMMRILFRRHPEVGLMRMASATEKSLTLATASRHFLFAPVTPFEVLAFMKTFALATRECADTRRRTLALVAENRVGNESAAQDERNGRRLHECAPLLPTS